MVMSSKIGNSKYAKDVNKGKRYLSYVVGEVYKVQVPITSLII